jgi:DNA/RNA-binding domain of Phe-tRNA-synthetase-like protein
MSGVCYAVWNLSNKRRSAKFDALAMQSVQVMLSTPAECDREDSILADFRRLHQSVGANDAAIVSSPESLLNSVRRNGRLPRINLLVDIYNLISIETRLSLGAHDIKHVHGDIRLRLADGSERFVPLGSAAPQPVRKGQYCYVDDANDVLCWLDVRQCDKSKVSLDTREAFVMVQGNRATDAQYLQAAGDRLGELINRFCGGVVTPVWASW